MKKVVRERNLREEDISCMPGGEGRDPGLFLELNHSC